MAAKPKPRLEALGFCGADDSVNPRHLALIGRNYPAVEWGVLFRPGKEGTPRYASRRWVERLSEILESDPGRVRLAAHLCGSHVNDLLSPSAESAKAAHALLGQLGRWGFWRVQVNATAVNGVDTENLGEGATARAFLRAAGAHSGLEFIVQRNDETEPLWSALLKNGELPSNVVFLHDESKGTGKEAAGGWPTDPRFVSASRKSVGFAGGIKPANVESVALAAREACTASGGDNFWIDMESGVRTTALRPDGTKEDVFDLAKCYNCIDTVCEAGLMSHPEGLR